ncbi:MAG: hypothetical protein M1377_02345 [Deltaproteobacteria bacterium]|nr:hypothetical protein [Deltaproteobacteria bacterium]
MRNLSPLRRSLSLSLLALALGASPALAEADIPIIVDGLPLDARAIRIKDEVYVPAWILENYAHTKVNWMRQANILEIMTAAPAKTSPPGEGALTLKIGFYLDDEGFVVGKNARLFLLNVDPKELKFPDGKSPAERAHEGAVERVGNPSRAMRDYLMLHPTDRFSPKGWNLVARMPKEEIVTLSAMVDRYEQLYKGLYYDLVMNVVIGKENELHASSVIDESLKGLRIDKVPVRDDGSAGIKLPNGLYFLYARMLYRNRQIVWDIPVSVRGGETFMELSNRNAALMQ